MVHTSKRWGIKKLKTRGETHFEIEHFHCLFLPFYPSWRSSLLLSHSPIPWRDVKGKETNKR